MVESKKITGSLILACLGLTLWLTIDLAQAANLPTGGIEISWPGAKASYKSQQSAKVNFKITNKTNVDLLQVVIETGYTSVVMPVSSPMTKTVDLARGKSYTGTIDAGKISELYEPGKLQFFVRLTDVNGQELAVSKYSTQIKTLASAPIQVIISNKKVFKVGEAVPITIKTTSAILKKIKPTITILQNNKKIISYRLISVNWTPKATGTYQIKVSANMVGYKAFSYESEIVVISKPLTIFSVKDVKRKQELTDQTTKQIIETGIQMSEAEQITYLKKIVSQSAVGRPYTGYQVYFLIAPQTFLRQNGFVKAQELLSGKAE